MKDSRGQILLDMSISRDDWSEVLPNLSLLRLEFELFLWLFELLESNYSGKIAESREVIVWDWLNDAVWVNESIGQADHFVSQRGEQQKVVRPDVIRAIRDRFKRTTLAHRAQPPTFPLQPQPVWFQRAQMTPTPLWRLDFCAELSDHA